MGICSSSTTKKEKNEKPNEHAQGNISNRTNGDRSKSENANKKPILSKDPNIEEKLFSDFESWEGDRFKGEGIKKMKGYKCDMKIDELNKLREEFWSSKKSNKDTWKILKLACLTDYVKSASILKDNNIQTAQGCLNECRDSKNILYKIPNFCINDPYFEKEYIDVAEQDITVTDKLNLVIYDLYDNKKLPFTIESNITGMELKQLYSDHFVVNLNQYKVRLLFGGAEIKDEQNLYGHKVKDGYTIHVVKSKIEPE